MSFSRVIRDELLEPRGINTIDPAPGGLGLSGAKVYRARSADQAYCLRRWPAGTKMSRVAEVHRVMMAARRAGCEYVPKVYSSANGQTVVCCDTSTWELCEWMSGECVARDMTVEDATLAALAIGSLHDALATEGSSMAPPPAIAARIARIDELKRIDLASAAASVGAGLRGSATRAVDIWTRHHPSIRYRLLEVANQQVRTQWVVRDLHPEHILFTGDSKQRAVSGIVDYDALRIDSPATDLARFIGGCDGLSKIEIEQVVAAYRAKRSFSEQEQMLVHLINEATQMIAAAAWVQWLCVEKRTFDAGFDKAKVRFELCTRRAEMIFR